MRCRSRQRGITLVVIAIAMVALLAIAGLALDIGRLVGDKARLQASVDAAALAAAKALDTTGSTILAAAAGTTGFNNNVAQQRDLAASAGNLQIQYSNTLQPFVPGSNPPLYVHVSATGFNIAATLSAVLGFNNFALEASAIAGPSPTLTNACNLAPLMMCGVAPTGTAPVYGYSVGQITALQLSPGTSAATLAPGYFLQQASGVNSQDQDFAGGYTACSTTGNNEPAQTGISPTPAAQGLDTRFNEYLTGDLNSGNYPPDAITTQPAGANRLSCSDPTCATVVTGGGSVITNASQYPTYSYEGMYLPNLRAQNYTNPPAPNGNGAIGRRVLAVPVAACPTAVPGNNNLPVLGLACVFLLQDVDPVAGQVFGEVIQSCKVNGAPGPAPNNGPGPYSIQLYHVPFSRQS